VTEEEAREIYLYPSGLHRMACASNNNGAPTCTGDGGFCGYSRELGQQVCAALTEDPA
jgi:hypothetical protein